MATTRTAFISGHTDLSQDEFELLYAPKIEAAIAKGDRVLLGDAAGVDTQALDLLLSSELLQKYPGIVQQVTIYASREQNVFRLRKFGVQVVGPKDSSLRLTDELEDIIGFKNSGRDKARFRHTLRDAYLTLNSDYDILHARSEQESRNFYGVKYRDRLSATEMNRRRRLILQAKAEDRPPPDFEISDVKSGKYLPSNQVEIQGLLEELPGYGDVPDKD